MTKSEAKRKFERISAEQFLEYKQLTNFFMITADLLCVAGFDGYFKKINPAVSKLLGYTPAELLAKPINEFVCHEDKSVTTSSRNFVYNGSALLNFENRYQTKSGEIVWLSWTSIPDLDAKLVFAIAKNITPKKAIEEERNEFIANLTAINEDLKRFSQMTSHDMRSPVNNLLAISSLLDSASFADPKAAELVKLLKLTSENLHSTVNNFMDVMIKNEKIDHPIEPLDLEAALCKVMASIGSLIKGSGTQIRFDFSEVRAIHFNPSYLESIFLNLITNAIKYAHPDRHAVIEISSYLVEGGKQIRISDNGLGFNLEEVKDKIFRAQQVFHRHNDSKGMGLHLVYQHVTSLGGEITVESDVNRGTTFIITLKN